MEEDNYKCDLKECQFCENGICTYYKGLDQGKKFPPEWIYARECDDHYGFENSLWDD